MRQTDRCYRHRRATPLGQLYAASDRYFQHRLDLAAALAAAPVQTLAQLRTDPTFFGLPVTGRHPADLARAHARLLVAAEAYVASCQTPSPQEPSC